jgi:hypothetical protein
MRQRVLGIILSVLLCCARAYAADSTAVPASTPLMEKSPTTAVLWSLALPGLGQYYTETYWKIPLFTGGALASAWLIVDNHAKYQDADAAYLAALDGNEAYRDNRDVAGLALVATYLIAAVDAYVGAHLFAFDVGDDLSLRLGPTTLEPVRLTLVARF